MKQKYNINNTSKFLQEHIKKTIEEAMQTRMCKEYKRYCEEVFSRRIPDKTSKT